MTPEVIASLPPDIRQVLKSNSAALPLVSWHLGSKRLRNQDPDVWTNGLERTLSTRTILTLASFILASCAHTPAPALLKPVPCVTSTPAEPNWPTASLSPDADIFTKTKTILAEIELRISYEAQLKAALLSCQ